VQGGHTLPLLLGATLHCSITECPPAAGSGGARVRCGCPGFTRPVAACLGGVARVVVVVQLGRGILCSKGTEISTCGTVLPNMAQRMHGRACRWTKCSHTQRVGMHDGCVDEISIMPRSDGVRIDDCVEVVQQGAARPRKGGSPVGAAPLLRAWLRRSVARAASRFGTPASLDLQHGDVNPSEY
jgi:hypothetical protein